MTARGFGILAASLGLALAACAQPRPPEAPAQPSASAVTPTREDIPSRFVGLIGTRARHSPPFLGVPETNFYCLRSFLDRQTGETAHQLYVADSYFGEKRGWDGAHDGAGNALPFTPIGTNEITCEDGCSYAEEFAATIPPAVLLASAQGLAVTFTARSGEAMTIALSGEQIAGQLAAVDAERRQLPPQTAASADQAALAAALAAGRTSTTFSADLPKK